MTKTLNTTFAAALIAASAFGASAAFAASSGDYFPGGNREQAQSQNIDNFRTHSISDKRVLVRGAATVEQAPDRGDYRSIAPVNGR